MSDNQRFDIVRYPSTSNRSLKSWNAADSLTLNYLEENTFEGRPIIYHDLFGFFSCFLSEFNPINITEYKSQETAIQRNRIRNSLPEPSLFHVTDEILHQSDLAIIRVPKSMGLFRMYLQSAIKNIRTNGTIVCGFMTRHFNPTMLKVAGEYFDNVEQSRAWKKSRLVILSGKKESIPEIQLENIPSQFGDLKQYPGVFSSQKIDIGTLFLLDHLDVQDTEQTILDLASGNGILAKAAARLQPSAEIHLMDDSWLAMESSKLNLKDVNAHFHHADTLDVFEDFYFDLVISNPPFHFGFENNIEISLSLFNGVLQKLKSGGRFKLVANRHLNYGIHLKKMFSSVQVVAQNKKFEILEAIK